MKDPAKTGRTQSVSKCSRVTKYFGGEYMKYWYAAFAVIIVCMVLSMLNDRSVRGYELYIYAPDGSLVSEEKVAPGYYEAERESLPVSKMFVPEKFI